MFKVNNEDTKTTIMALRTKFYAFKFVFCWQFFGNVCGVNQTLSHVIKGCFIHARANFFLVKKPFGQIKVVFCHDKSKLLSICLRQNHDLIMLFITWSVCCMERNYLRLVLFFSAILQSSMPYSWDKYSLFCMLLLIQQPLSCLLNKQGQCFMIVSWFLKEELTIILKTSVRYL